MSIYSDFQAIRKEQEMAYGKIARAEGRLMIGPSGIGTATAGLYLKDTGTGTQLSHITEDEARFIIASFSDIFGF